MQILINTAVLSAVITGLFLANDAGANKQQAYYDNTDHPVYGTK